MGRARFRSTDAPRHRDRNNRAGAAESFTRGLVNGRALSSLAAVSRRRVMAITQTSFLPHDTPILTIARAFLNIAFNVGSPGRLEDRVHRRLVRHHVIQREKAMRTTIATSKFAFLTVGVLALALLGTAGSASAGTWDQRHPRRAEVNDRLAIQNFRINRELREGEIG